MDIPVPVPYRIYAILRLVYGATGVAPHTETTRHAIACPTDAYIFVPNVYLYARRATAATTVGAVTVKVQYLIAATDIVTVALETFTDNTVGRTIVSHRMAGMWLRPGDSIRITTTDASTGGTCDYEIQCPLYYIR